jgi:quercetin dioxygenase-like cupin family protein
MAEIKVTHFENAPKVPFNLDGRIMFSSEKLELIHLTLKQGEGMDLHTQPFDVVFFVISGKGKLRLENDAVEGLPGTCIHVPAGVKRGWKNESSDIFSVLVVKDLK